MDETEASKDPRRNINEYEASVKWSEDGDGTMVQKLIFYKVADLLDARFELLSNNNAILIRDPEEVDVDGSQVIIIEPNRVSTDGNQIIMTAKETEE